MPRVHEFSPADRTIAAKLTAPTIDQLRAIARAHDRTLSGQIRRALREWLDAQASLTPEARADVGAAHPVNG